MLNYIAQAIGAVATGLLVFSFQCRSRKKLLLCWVLSTALWTLHYGLLAAWTGLAMEAVIVLRNCLQFIGKPWTKSRYTMLGIMGLIVIVTALTWKDVFCLLPMLALILGTYSLYPGKTDTIKRIQLFCVSPCWLFYNGYCGSIAGVVCEVLNIISVIVYFVRTPDAHLFGRKKQVAGDR